MTGGASRHSRGVTKGFVEVGGREVHYLTTGSGPVAVLLPAFPWSAGSLIDLIEALADTQTVVALDPPGYGNSHPLDGVPDIAAYADAVAETLAALGIERCHLYGMHSGAQVAVEVGLRHANRVVNLVLDGLPILTDGERQDMAENYCPEFEPSWDGRHIPAIWSWCRYQGVFWPWYRQSVASRLDADELPPEVLHQRAVDVLRAGPRYGLGLEAAFRHRARESLEALVVPFVLVAGEADPFLAHGERLGDSDVIGLRPAPGREEQIKQLIPSGGGADGAFHPPRRTSTVGAVERSYVRGSHGQVLMRRISGEGRPFVMLHASPTSSALLEPLMLKMCGGREIVAFDTAGNGDSDPPPSAGELRIADFAAIVDDALTGIGVTDYDLYGTHTGALIATEVALGAGGVRRLILEGVTLFDDGDRPDLLPRAQLLDDYLPEFAPRWDGTHLLAAWHFRRSFTMYWPWFRRSRAGIRRVPMVELPSFHRAFVEMLKSSATYHLPYRAALAYPTAARLPNLRVPTLIAAHPDDPLQAYTAEAAGLAGGAADVLPDHLDGVAELYEDFLSD